jgi:glycosyltransferase involved in cell wall biosynthesis
MTAGQANVAMVINELGLGGTQKGLVAHALRLDPSRFRVRVVGVHELGPRAQELEAGGVEVACAGGDQARLAELLAGADLAHVWRADPADSAMPRAVAEAGVEAKVETTIFGLVDRSGWAEQVGCRLYLSRSCASRYRRRTHREQEGFFERNRVLPLPLDSNALRAAAPARQEAKRGLGLDPGRPVAGRIGRPDDLKWRNLLVDMLPRLLELVPDAQILIAGATRAKLRRLRRAGVLDRCTTVGVSSDPAGVATLYAACDVFFSAAEIGESQGLAIAEAMAVGVPVVTCSTPWVDNAQVEYVENGRTGYLANHPAPFAEATAELLRDPARRERFGAEGRGRIDRWLDPDRLTRRLESLYQELLAGRPAPPDWEPSSADLASFEETERDRAEAEFRPLSAEERIEARSTRELERARRVRGLLRPSRLPLAASMVRARLAELRP